MRHWKGHSRCRRNISFENAQGKVKSSGMCDFSTYVPHITKDPILSSFEEKERSENDYFETGKKGWREVCLDGC